MQARHSFVCYIYENAGFSIITFQSKSPSYMHTALHREPSQQITITNMLVLETYLARKYAEFH